jgi:hypothetical protein
VLYFFPKLLTTTNDATHSCSLHRTHLFKQHHSTTHHTPRPQCL